MRGVPVVVADKVLDGLFDIGCGGRILKDGLGHAAGAAAMASDRVDDDSVPQR